MNGSKKAGLAEQVRRFRARFVQSAGAALGTVLTAHVLKNAVLEETGSWRERLYGPLSTLVLFIEQVLGADHSCQDTVARGLSARVAVGQAPCSLNTGPYCKARARLALGLIERLGREVAARLCAAQPAPWLWHGRPVKLVDGTTVSMPDTESNQRAFPQSRGQKPGLGFPLARLLGIVSLSCGAVLQWASGPCEGKNSGETALLWRLMDKLAAGDVVVADRYFAGYFAITRLRQLGVDVLIRQHQRRHTDFRRGQRLGKRDHDLYGKRWQVELDFRAIKTVMQMDVLRCKSPVCAPGRNSCELAGFKFMLEERSKGRRSSGLDLILHAEAFALDEHEGNANGLC
jgi:hypothetical protein